MSTPAGRVSRGPLRVLMLFGVREAPGPPERHVEYEEAMRTDENWLTEGHVLEALRHAGHEVTLGPIHRDVREILELIERAKPDVVWNACEIFQEQRHYEVHVAAMLELLGVPYTGCGFEALLLCKDKALSKKILKHHHVGVPQFVVSRAGKPIRKLAPGLLPAFVKPLASEGSEGISKDSFADTEDKALDRVRFLHESMKTDVIVERFIPGRELYVGVLGNDRLRIFPPRELRFANVPEGEPTYATYSTKWNREYRERWGIENAFAEGLDDAMLRAIKLTCRRAYRALRMRGYGRLDLRLAEDGRILVMEANPNPEIASGEDFAESAAKAGIPYEELITRILRLAMR